MPEQEPTITQHISGGIGHNIAGRDLTIGFTLEQVSAFLDKHRKDYQPQPFDGRSPYVGLASFQEFDVERFFGREELTKQLVKRVQSSRFVVIAGPSGSGKSSLARAGLIPALRKGGLTGSENWLYETLAPGRHPLEGLGRVVDNLKDLKAGDDLRREGWSDKRRLHRWLDAALGDQRTRRAVLFVDQFEESFTQAGDAERAAFFDLLVYAATVQDGRVTVICATRSDFIGNWVAYPNLNEQLSRAFDQIPPMQPDELISAIARPAQRVGLQIDPELVKQILDDMREAPGALPLMQFALDDLFYYEQSKGGVIALTRDDYLERGGLQKALARHADLEFEKLNADEQRIARSLFSGMIEPGRETPDGRTPDTKRTALLHELAHTGNDPELTRSVITKLADARLITTDKQDGQDVVTLAHDRLIDAWGWLKRLVDENRETIALQTEITEDAQEWQRHGNDSSYLYTGARLAAAREALADKNLTLGELAQRFLNAGIDVDQEARREREARRQKELEDARTIAVEQKRRADAEYHRRIESESRQFAAQSVACLEEAQDLALLLAVEANRAFDTFEARSALFSALQHNPRLKVFLRGFVQKNIPLVKPRRNPALVLNPDGDALIAVGGYHSDAVNVWDLTTYQLRAYLSSGDQVPVRAVACRHDGRLIAAGKDDGTIILWDVESWTRIGTPLVHATTELEYGGVTSLSFHPFKPLLASGAYDNNVVLWDGETGELVKKLQGDQTDSRLQLNYYPPTRMISRVLFSPTGKFLCAVGYSSSDETPNSEVTVVWDLETGRPLEPLKKNALAFIPHHDELVLIDEVEGAVAWDINQQQITERLSIPDLKWVESLSFDDAGNILAASKVVDDSIILWDVANKKALHEPLTGHTQYVDTVVVSKDGSTVMSTGGDDAVIVWDVAEGRSLARSFASGVGFGEITFSPDGKFLLAASENSVRVWDVSTAGLVRTRDFGNTVKNLSFGSTGQSVFVLASNHAFHLVDITLKTVPTETAVGHENLSCMALSPDGNTLAFGCDDGSIFLWNVATRQPLTEKLATGSSNRVTALAFSLDGARVAIGHEDGTINLWRADGDAIKQFAELIYDEVIGLLFHPDGKLFLATGRERMYLWNIQTTHLINQHSTGSSIGAALHARFSPDGRILAWLTGSRTAVSLMDARVRHRFGTPLVYEDKAPWSLAFNPDGKTLAVAYQDASIMFWDLNVESWIRRACTIANRDLTPEERDQYLGSPGT